jgi:hypothetical protein
LTTLFYSRFTYKISGMIRMDRQKMVLEATVREQCSCPPVIVTTFTAITVAESHAKSLSFLPSYIKIH